MMRLRFIAFYDATGSLKVKDACHSDDIVRHVGFSDSVELLNGSGIDLTGKSALLDAIFIKLTIRLCVWAPLAVFSRSQQIGTFVAPSAYVVSHSDRPSVKSVFTDQISQTKTEVG